MSFVFYIYLYFIFGIIRIRRFDLIFFIIIINIIVYGLGCCLLFFVLYTCYPFTTLHLRYCLRTNQNNSNNTEKLTQMGKHIQRAICIRCTTCLKTCKQQLILNTKNSLRRIVNVCVFVARIVAHHHPFPCFHLAKQHHANNREWRRAQRKMVHTTKELYEIVSLAGAHCAHAFVSLCLSLSLVHLCFGFLPLFANQLSPPPTSPPHLPLCPFHLANVLLDFVDFKDTQFTIHTVGNSR